MHSLLPSSSLPRWPSQRPARGERFGHDSVDAVPGKTVATEIVASVDVTRYGRDSVYATQAPATGKTIVGTTAGADVAFKARPHVMRTRGAAELSRPSPHG